MGGCRRWSQHHIDRVAITPALGGSSAGDAGTISHRGKGVFEQMDGTGAPPPISSRSGAWRRSRRQRAAGVIAGVVSARRRGAQHRSGKKAAFSTWSVKR
jgi:hypothetical protein